MADLNNWSGLFFEWLKNSKDAVIITDVKGIILFANPVACQRWKISEKEVLQQPIEKFSKIFTKEYTWEANIKAIRAQGTITLETTHINTEGNIYPVEAELRLVKFENKEYIIGVVKDITEQKIKEKKLLRSEALLSEIYEHSTDGIFLIDNSNWEITECNTIALKMFECSPEYIVGKKAGMLPKKSFTDEESIENIRILKEQGYYNRVVEYQTARGNSFWGDTASTIIHIEGREFYLTRITDVSSSVNVKEALERSEKKFRDLIHYSQALICTHDVNGKILSINPASLRAVEAESEEQVIGLNLGDLFEEKNKGLFDEYLRKIHSDEELTGIMSVRSFKGKRLYWMYHNYKVVIEGEESYVVGFAQDISDRLAMEKELKTAKETAEESLRSRDTFLAMMSHEMRTPLNGIIGITRLLKRTELASKQTDYMRMIENSADSLLVIINDLLDLSKIESGKIELEHIPFDLQRSISAVIEPLRIRAEEKGLSLVSDMSKVTQPILIGDPVRLNQIILNLISNAIKFTKNGFIKIIAETKPLNDDQIELTIHVQDSGIGIPTDKQESIFEAFTQSHSSTTRQYGGTGLGLTISRKIAQLHHGKITVHSKEQEGSTFTLDIPYAIGKGILKEKFSEQSIHADLHEVRILVAEDNELNQYITKVMLTEYHCIPDLASNGKIAVEMFERNQYDLILMDIQMPEMDGIEATKKIRQLKGHKAAVPIVALTANAMKSDQEKYIEAGMNGHIAKPFKENELIETICILLQKPYHFAKKQNEKNEDLIILPSHQLYTLEYVNDLTGGDQQMIKEMVNVFVQTTLPELQKIRNLLRDEKTEDIKNVLHKLKSTLKTFHISNIEDDIRQIEAYEGNTPMIEFRLRVNRLISFIQIVIDHMQKDVN
jgi:PAS domain S-box-containing protein